jgi:hypothetical protein
MSNRSSRSAAASRAEARRRARHLAHGHELDEGDGSETDAAPAGPATARPTFLTRLFPAAPPLPGKPDPLAGFTYSGPLPGIVSSLYLLARYPLVWGIAGAAWAVARILTELTGNSLIGIVASLISFASLIAAGWIGWRRPWLYGLAASVLGLLIYVVIWTPLLTGQPGIRYSGGALLLAVISRDAFQPLFGALAGWYGGYLRRRLAAAPSQVRGARRR